MNCEIRAAPPSAPTVKAWDIPTRLFKWSLVILILSAWVSSGFTDPDMVAHKAMGYGVLTLIVFRLLWGIVGGSTARFSAFIYSPGAVMDYLRAVRAGTARPYLGHTPAGGWMIMALILACAVQTLLGLFASDGVAASGPLADVVSESVSNWATVLHKVWFYVILALAAVHIVANLYYQFVKRENLVGAIITGRKKYADYVDAHHVREGALLVAGVCVAVAIGIIYFGVTLAGGSFFSAL